jgi:hypothetical protein
MVCNRTPELKGRKNLQVIDRALNARSIMSNIISDMTTPDEIPYYIWHPEVATEEIYRRLAARYPEMRYQVGRACAVAGYTALYQELAAGLLPDVHIAEEARDNGATRIYELIMAHRDKYSVMNDYTRTVDLENPPKACLNGDTAVRSSLEIKQAHSTKLEPRYYDITEDMNIDEYIISEHEQKQADDATPLLYSPLPLDLPAVNKDLLNFNGCILR